MMIESFRCPLGVVSEIETSRLQDASATAERKGA